jgi:hypothetical protein
MTGLLFKDIQYMIKRRETLLIFIIASLIIGFSTSNTSFLLGYIMLLAMLMSIGSISYDEFDNGMPFIMTLPVTRKQYVASKYILCFITGLISFIAAFLILYAIRICRGMTFVPEKDLESGAAAFFAISVIYNLTIPVQLKFGSEKSRIVLGIFAGCAVAGVAFMRYMDIQSISSIATAVVSMPVYAIAAIFLAVYAIMIVVSICISFRIMEKKEF